MDRAKVEALMGSPDFRVLAESARYLVGHEFEAVLLVEKATGAGTPLGHHHGDPTCAVIGPSEGWVAVGGLGVTYWDPARGVRTYLRSPGRWVRALRAVGPHTLRILLDPWSDYAAVWELDTRKLSLRKLRDGPALADEPYRDEVAY